MGLTIFYSGKLRNMQLLPLITREVMDICNNLQWISDDFKYWPEIPLRGFQFHPPGSEPIWLTFREDGVLVDPVYLSYPKKVRAKMPQEQKFLLYSVTQYAGTDAHIALIKLLRYLSNKYFDEFQLVDESEYWETGNAEKCRDWFEMFGVWMDNMSADLGKLDGRGDEAGNIFQSRVNDLLQSGKSFEDILKVIENPYRK